MNLAAIYQPLLIIAAALAGIILGSVEGLREASAHIITPALAALLYMVFLSADGDLKAKGEAAVAAGDAGARSTRDLVAKLGRARPLGQKSVGTPDPGAVSLVKVAAVVVERI